MHGKFFDLISILDPYIGYIQCANQTQIIFFKNFRIENIFFGLTDLIDEQVLLPLKSETTICLILRQTTKKVLCWL